MKFCIDTEECKKLEVPLDELLYMIGLYLGVDINSSTVFNIFKRGIVEHDGYDLLKHMKNPKLVGEGINIVESYLLKSEFNTPKYKNRFENLAEQLREIYPKGKKPGTAYMWRDSNAIITKKLQALVKQYGDCFTDEEAIEATKRYVESFNGNYQYMQLLKYFISKAVVKDNQVETSSQLLSYIENAKDSNAVDSFDEMRYD